jgi:hypothetical protein
LPFDIARADKLPLHIMGKLPRDVEGILDAIALGHAILLFPNDPVVVVRDAIFHAVSPTAYRFHDDYNRLIGEWMSSLKRR